MANINTGVNLRSSYVDWLIDNSIFTVNVTAIVDSSILYSNLVKRVYFGIKTLIFKLIYESINILPL